MKYCYIMKKIQILPFVTTWMDLEGIMLSEISHTDKQVPYAFTICGIKISKQLNKHNKTDS